MSSGKMAAQAVHAGIMSTLRSLHAKEWRQAPHRTVLIMEARDETHLTNIADYLEERGILTFSIVDEGVNEIEPHVLTSVATEIINKDDENVALTMSTFRLYHDRIRFITEVDM